MINLSHIAPNWFPHQNSKAYALYIPKLNAIYNYIPKNACSTIKYAVMDFELGQYELSIRLKDRNIHSLVQEYKLINKSFSEISSLVLCPKFIVMRCPLQRLASGFFDKFFRPYIYNIEPEPFVKSFLADHKLSLKNISFKDFLEICFTSRPTSLNDHFKPQITMMPFDGYELIVPLEKMSSHIKINNHNLYLSESKNVNNLALKSQHISFDFDDLNYIYNSPLATISKREDDCKTMIPPNCLWSWELLGLDQNNIGLYKYDQIIYDMAMKEMCAATG